MYPSRRETGLGANVALPNNYFGGGSFVPAAPRAITPQTYFNAPALVPQSRPVTTTARPVSSPFPMPVSRLPVAPSPKPTVSVDTFGVPSPVTPSPASPAINVSVSGGATAAPDGTIVEKAGMFGLSDVNPTSLVFIGMAALVIFMESKKGRR